MCNPCQWREKPGLKIREILMVTSGG